MALLKEAVRGLTKVFYVAPETTWTTAVGLGVKAAAEKSGVELIGPPVESPHQEADYTKAFASAPKHADAFLISSALKNFTNRNVVINLSQEYRFPALYPYKDYVTAGVLMTHDIDQRDLYLAIIDQIVKICNGANPEDIPIYQPKHFRFVINMSAVKAIGFQFSQNLVAAADEVID
jgi:putative ABC transport system substrate-binding protein